MPHKFTDAAGREWALTVDINATKRVKGLLGLDLLSDVENALTKLGDDIVLLVDVLYVLCKDQADAREVSDVEFGRALTGDPIEAAGTALMQEIADFFPSRKRAALKMLLEKSQSFSDKALELTEARTASLNPEEEISILKAQLEDNDRRRRELWLKTGANTAGSGPGSTPGSPESTRGP